MEEKEIIRRIRQGEIELFSFIVERYQDRLLRFIFSLSKQKMLAEEIGQAVFLAFYKSLDTFDETKDPPVSAWLYTAARNMTINALKTETRHYRLMQSGGAETVRNGETPPDILVRKEDRQMLEYCLSQLDEPYQSAIRDSLLGLSIKEAAARQAVLPGTVKSRLHRAKIKLTRLFHHCTREERHE